MSEQDKDKEEAPEAAENTETETPTETSPALPPTKDADKPLDQISATIGEVGRWQLQKILIVFLASAPGNADYYLLDHLYTWSYSVPRVISHFPCEFHNPEAEVLVRASDDS